MLSFFTHIDGRIVAIVTVVLIGIVGFILIMSSQGNGVISSSKNPQPSVAPSQSKTAPTPAVKSLKDVLPRSYLSDTFAFSYPGDWQGQQETMVGGQQITYTPKNSKSSFTPRISFTQDTNTKTIAERAKFYIEEGFQQSTVYIGNQQWIKVSGNLPAEGLKNSGTAQKVYETDVFTIYQGETYTISYKYESVRPDTGLDNIFSQILSTFQFF